MDTPPTIDDELNYTGAQPYGSRTVTWTFHTPAGIDQEIAFMSVLSQAINMAWSDLDTHAIDRVTDWFISYARSIGE